eukprot:155368-Chlamydomonas_euryale.AAC.1
MPGVGCAVAPPPEGADGAWLVWARTVGAWLGRGRGRSGRGCGCWWNRRSAALSQVSACDERRAEAAGSTSSRPAATGWGATLTLPTDWTCAAGREGLKGRPWLKDPLPSFACRFRKNAEAGRLPDLPCPRCPTPFRTVVTWWARSCVSGGRWAILLNTGSM